MLKNSNNMYIIQNYKNKDGCRVILAIATIIWFSNNISVESPGLKNNGQEIKNSTGHDENNVTSKANL